MSGLEAFLKQICGVKPYKRNVLALFERLCFEEIDNVYKMKFPFNSFFWKLAYVNV